MEDYMQDVSIAAIVKNSLVDYPEKISCVVFFQGCNYDCYYCHNRDLIPLKGNEQRPPISHEYIFNFLESRRDLLDGVVLTGGEPTLQKGLPAFTEKVLSMGYPVKLDTNGSNPGMLKLLLDKHLLDYIAMDIKAPFNDYEKIMGSNIFLGNVKRSANIIMNSGINYEFRTTYAPDLAADDIENIAKDIKGAMHYVLQQFREPPQCGGIGDARNLKPAHDAAYILKTAEIIRQYVKKVSTRGI